MAKTLPAAILRLTKLARKRMRHVRAPARRASAVRGVNSHHQFECAATLRTYLFALPHNPRRARLGQYVAGIWSRSKWDRSTGFETDPIEGGA